MGEFTVKVTGALQSQDPVARAVELTPDELDRLEKTRLYARSGSPLLVGLVEKSIRKTWFETIGIEEDDLTPEELLDVDFVLGGEMAMLQQMSIEIDAHTIAALAARPLGRGIFAMLSDLLQAHRSMM